ncbi:restriction endonuclease subunit S [Vibrio cholerae]|nr:restriction endonuclease subunit S [Vibrio cholerae]EGR2121014.1 restriction endonuclease subunit S [Vibrio cholerae]EGR2127447.1 restriction endonuclease subunit S [Vibrio cholerae]
MKLVTLDSVLTFHRGITFKPDDKVEVGSSESVVCLRTKNIQKELDESDLLAVPSSFVKRDELYVNQGDILISTANSWELVGKCVRVVKTQYKSTIGGFISLLRPKSELIDPDYLFRFLSMDETQERIRHLGKKTTNISNLDRVRFLQLQIPLPPLETQKQIAAVLEKADQLRQDCKLLEQELNSLAQSVFIDMFGDVRSNSFNSKKVKFDDIFEINSKLVDPRLPEFENLPHIGPEHLEKRTGRILPYRTAKEDALVSGKFNFQKGCVLFSKIRPNLKKVAIPEFSGLCSADMYPLEVIDGVSTREFIWGLILSDAFDDYLETLPSRANIPKINRKELAAFEFYLPDLRDQKAYSKKLAKIQEQLKQNACLYQETENNFNALIQKAFKGELTL